MIDTFPWTDAADTTVADLPELTGEYLIHLPGGLEINGVPTYPDDAPQCHGCPEWDLAQVYADDDGWWPEPIATGLTVPQAHELARELGATRVIGA